MIALYVDKEKTWADCRFRRRSLIPVSFWIARPSLANRKFLQSHIAVAEENVMGVRCASQAFETALPRVTKRS
jgi:hypothetical protein